MMKLDRKVNISSDIPTASMPDIIFMLLIFFMVTTVLREYSGLDIELPKAQEGGDWADMLVLEHQEELSEVGLKKTTF